VLTPEECALIQDLGQCYTRLAALAGDGPGREDDLREARSHVHVLQNMIKAQAAGRLYPQFRLLGAASPVPVQYEITTDRVPDGYFLPGETETAAWLAGYFQHYYLPGSDPAQITGIFACPAGDVRMPLEITHIRDDPEGEFTDRVFSVHTEDREMFAFTARLDSRHLEES
jgi:hypothetical protein